MATSSFPALRAAILTSVAFLGPPLSMGFRLPTEPAALSIVAVTERPAPVAFELLTDAGDAPQADEPAPPAAPTRGAERASPPAPEPPAGTADPIPAHTARPEVHTVARQGSRKPGRRCLDPDPRITEHGADAFTVERSLVDEVTHSIKTINDLGWAARHRAEDGSVDGFRVGGIRCGSPLHTGGLRNGDVITRVNGERVTTWPKALLLYRKLRKQEAFTVGITRRGQPLEIHYRVT